MLPEKNICTLKLSMLEYNANASSIHILTIHRRDYNYHMPEVRRLTRSNRHSYSAFPKYNLRNEN